MEQAATFIILNQSGNFKSALSGKSTACSNLVWSFPCLGRLCHAAVALNVLSVDFLDPSISGEGIYW